MPLQHRLGRLDRAGARARTPCRRPTSYARAARRSKGPRCPACARSWARSFDRRRVRRHDDQGRVRARPRRPARRRGSGSRRSASRRPRRSPPSAFTAASAADDHASPSTALAVPTPPFQAAAGSGALGHRRARPRADAALGDRAVGRRLARGVAGRGVRPGERRRPTARSNSTAAGTIGTRATPVSNPTPRSSSQRATPSAAARPNALPPVSRTACTSFTIVPGRIASVSRVPGRRPSRRPTRRSRRAEHDGAAGEPAGSVQCPTRMPGTSVIDAAPRRLRRSERARFARSVPPGRLTRWRFGGSPRSTSAANRSRRRSARRAPPSSAMCPARSSTSRRPSGSSPASATAEEGGVIRSCSPTITSAGTRTCCTASRRSMSISAGEPLGPHAPRAPGRRAPTT